MNTPKLILTLLLTTSLTYAKVSVDFNNSSNQSVSNLTAANLNASTSGATWTLNTIADSIVGEASTTTSDKALALDRIGYDFDLVLDTPTDFSATNYLFSIDSQIVRTIYLADTKINRITAYDSLGEAIFELLLMTDGGGNDGLQGRLAYIDASGVTQYLASDLPSVGSTPTTFEANSLTNCTIQLSAKGLKFAVNGNALASGVALRSTSASMEIAGIRFTGDGTSTADAAGAWIDNLSLTSLPGFNVDFNNSANESAGNVTAANLNASSSGATWTVNTTADSMVGDDASTPHNKALALDRIGYDFDLVPGTAVDFSSSDYLFSLDTQIIRTNWLVDSKINRFTGYDSAGEEIFELLLMTDGSQNDGFQGRLAYIDASGTIHYLQSDLPSVAASPTTFDVNELINSSIRLSTNGLEFSVNGAVLATGVAFRSPIASTELARLSLTGDGTINDDAGGTWIDNLSLTSTTSATPYFAEDFDSAAWQAIASPNSGSHEDIGVDVTGATLPNGWRFDNIPTWGDSYVAMANGAIAAGNFTHLSSSNSIALKNRSVMMLPLTNVQAGEILRLSFDYETLGTTHGFMVALYNDIPRVERGWGYQLFEPGQRLPIADLDSHIMFFDGSAESGRKTIELHTAGAEDTIYLVFHRTGLDSSSPVAIDNLEISKIHDLSNDYLLSELIGYWPMDGTVEDARDWNRLDGHARPGVSFTTGKIGLAAALNGPDGIIDLNAGNLDSQEWSLACWVQRTDVASTIEALFESSDFSFRLEQEGTNGLLGFSNIGVSDKDFNGSMPTNQWVHLAMVGNPFDIGIYIDGVPVGSTTYMEPAGHIVNPNWKLGMDRIGDGNLDLILDEVAVWSRSLGAAEVIRLYQGGANGQTIPQIAQSYTRASQGLPGPGLNLGTYTTGEILATFQMAGQNQRMRVPAAGMHNGWLYILGRDAFRASSGGAACFDISDIRNPKRMTPYHDVGYAPHTYSVVSDPTHGQQLNISYESARTSGSGLYDMKLFPTFDWAYSTSFTPITAPQNKSFLAAPYAFHGQNGYGHPTPMEIWDLRPADYPELIWNTNTHTDYGFRGQAIVFGDIMFLVGNNTDSGIASYDIKDPENPVLLDTLITGVSSGYEPTIYKNFMVLGDPSTSGTDPGMCFVDISDPSNLQLLPATTIPRGEMGTDNRYCQFQDNYLFVGNQKWDLTPLEQGQKPTLVNTFNVPVSNYQYVIGNVVFFGQMESSGTVNTCNIVAHQANPDTTVPTVAGHRPLDGATDCSTIAPIGILIHESLNNETVHAQSVILRKKENQDVISGLITIDDGDILSFVPDTPLEYLTEYEMTLPAGGITDIVGNPISEYRFSFTTGAASGSDTTAPILNSITSTAYPVSVGENVTLSADTSDDSGATVQYKWGDGSWGTVSSHSLSFNTEGHHQLELRTRDIYGNVQLHTYLVTVSNNTAITEDYRSSKIVLDETNRLVWTVNPDNDSVTAIDADTLNVIYEVSVGDQPRYLELVGNEIWVSCKGVNRIDVINTANGLLSGNHPLDYGDAPAGLVYHHSSDKVYLVTQGTGALWKLDATTGAVESSLYLGAEANTVTVSSDGTRALISKFISEGSSGTIWDVDTSNMTLSGTINLSKEMTPDGDSAGRGLPNYITDVSINQARNEAWFSASKANIDRGEFLEGGNGQAPSLAFQNTVRAISGVIDLTTSTEDLALRIDHDNQAFPSGTLFTPLGDYAIVALRGSNSLRVMDTLTGGIAAKQNEIIVELSPDGMVFDPTTNRLFTKNFMSRSVSAHDLGDFLQWGLPITSAGVVNTVTNEGLATDILLGKQIFYNAADVRMSQDGYLSCASCHDDGSMDGMTWDFTERGEGLRNTTSLEGRRGMGHGLVHWSANFDEIQDFEHDIRGPQGGLGFMDNTDFNTGTRNTTLGDSKAGVSPDLDALAAYVTSLDAYPQSPYRNADGSMTAEALAGETHYRSQRCVDCHVGNDFTESKVGTLMDIGTMDASSGNRLGGPLDGIDVPSLRGIWQTPPYLHNGSAATLQEVFDSTHAPAGTAHAKFRDLSQTQQDELIAFLLQLDGNNAEVHSPKLMHGVISNVSSEQWSTIDLGLNYNSPVIIATPIYPDNTQTPIVTRIQNVGTTSFELRLDRLDGQSGEILCDVSIVVVEEGVYTTAEDGVKMEAVRFDSSVTAYRNNWVSQARTYQNSYINPVVLGQVMSANDNWSAFWCHGPSIYDKPNSSTLSIGKHVGEDPNNSRLNEEIGYIVIEAGSGEINGIKYYAQVGPDIVRNYTDNGGAPFQYDISAGSLSSVSAAILSISAMDGNDGAWAVLSGALPTPTTMELVADEDILKDNERKHATEEVGYLIFE